MKGFGIILIAVGVIGLFINFVTGLVMIGIGVALIIWSKKLPPEKKNSAITNNETFSEQPSNDTTNASEMAADALNEDDEQKQ